MATTPSANRYRQRWLDLNPEKRREAYIGYWRRLRLAALEAYGRVCACCGESRIEFLAVDHIGGAGNEHRRNVKARSGQNLYNWLKSNGYPPGFRVLCHNCNMALGFYGYCPHAEVA